MTVLKEFYEWVGRQSGTYGVRDNCNCPMANFAKEVKGLKYPHARTFEVDEAVGPNNEFGYAPISYHGAVDFGVGVYHIIRLSDNYETLHERMTNAYAELLA